MSNLSIFDRPGSLPSPVTIDDALVEFVETLDREVEMLATIRYRLIVLGALAGADQSQSIPTAVRETEIAYEALRLLELVRGSVTVRLADEFNLGPMPRIDELAARASDGWSEILLDRRRTLIEAVTEIQGLAGALTSAMGRRAAMAEEALASIRADRGATYGRAVPHEGVLVEGSI